MTIRVSTELPIPAEHACALARKPALLRHVLWPWVSVRTDAPLPENVAEGERIDGRLRFFGIAPGWRHTIDGEALHEREIRSREHGSLVKAWNHTLTFEPVSPTSCRYTDTVDLHAGLRTPLVALFAHLIYRYRGMRWRALARVLA